LTKANIKYFAYSLTVTVELSRLNFVRNKKIQPHLFTLSQVILGKDGSTKSKKILAKPLDSLGWLLLTCYHLFMRIIILDKLYLV
jgi:hypothetical protein